MTTTIVKPPKDTPFTADLPKITPLMEARALQRLVFHKATGKKITPLALSHLAKAWCVLQDAIREMRGIPKAGHLRPDLDPEQLTKALKRARSRKPILDMLASAHERPDETPQEPSKGTPREAIESKESLLPDGPVTTEGGGDGAETRGAPFHKP